MSDFTSRTPTVTPTDRRLHTEPEVPKIAFSPCSFAFRQTNSITHVLFAPFLCQSVPFITRQVYELLLSPQSQELSSKATKQTSPYYTMYEPHPLRIFIIAHV